MDVKESEAENAADEKSATPNGQAGPEEQKENGREVSGPTVGFDKEGYFFVKIHMSFSYLAMVGFLEEAKEWLMINHKGSARNRQKAEEASKLVKPKGFRGFFH